MGTEFLLLYKRFEDGRLSWPGNIEEAAELTEDQYRYLMTGLNPHKTGPVCKPVAFWSPDRKTG